MFSCKIKDFARQRNDVGSMRGIRGPVHPSGRCTVGFFSKIFGGGKKSDSREIGTVPEEQKPVKEEAKTSVSTASPEPIPDEDRVPEPQPREESEAHVPAPAEHKATVFGMPAPPFAAGSVPVSGEAVVGEAVVGELDVPAQPRVQDAPQAGEIVVGETAADTVKEEVASPAEPAASPEVSGAAEPAAVESASGPAPENEEAEEIAVEAEAVAPPPLPAASTAARAVSAPQPVVEETPAADDIELFPKAEKRDSRSSIECTSCRHRLPVPYVGYPARITCPFCLTVNDYNL